MQKRRIMLLCAIVILLCSMLAMSSCQPTGRGGKPIEMVELQGDITDSTKIFPFIISKTIENPLVLKTYQLRDCDSVCSTDTLYVFLSDAQKDHLDYLINKQGKKLWDIHCVIINAREIPWKQERLHPQRIRTSQAIIPLQFY